MMITLLLNTGDIGAAQERTRRLTREIDALKVATDALLTIAELGGVQGDWALDALEEVRARLARQSLRVV